MEQKEDLPYIELVCDGNQSWLDNRRKRIGGSSASVIMGLNKYRNERDLFDEMTSNEKPKENGNELTRYGHEAEPPLRKLFALHHPEIVVTEPNEENPVILISKKYPFMSATLDANLYRPSDNKKGFYEGKTCHIQNPSMFAEWKDGVPQSYYCQVVHYFAVTEFDFAYLQAECIWESYDAKGVKHTNSSIKEYYFEREDIIQDINLLISTEEKFYKDYILTNTRPRDRISFSI